MYEVLIIFMLIILFWRISCREKLMVPGVANRYEVVAYIDKTYGGTDKIKLDPRFGI